MDLRANLFRSLLLAAGLALAAGAPAAAVELSEEQMILQLKGESAAPRTRGLRNLRIEATGIGGSGNQGLYGASPVMAVSEVLQ